MTPGRRLEPGIAGHDLRRGAGFMITATLLFATMAACIKHASADLPTGMIVFFRNAISLATLLPWLARQGVSTLRTTRWRDGVRFEETSLGYPAQWQQAKTAAAYLRPILPEPAPVAGWGDDRTVLRHP